MSKAAQSSASGVADTPATIDSPAGLAHCLAVMQAAQLAHRPDYSERMRALLRLRRAVSHRLEAMVDAASADFGHRSRHETLLSDAMTVLSEIDHVRAELRGWMRRERVATGPLHWPARNEIQRHPVGVVGILSPWNYPINLALVPLIGAIAAGNRVMLKPSEHTPRVAALLGQLLADVFPSDQVAVAIGDAELAQAFSALAFDHLFFTGSTAVGRKVMAAAAPNLTPVTLELGGKSPAFVSSRCDITETARRIALAKCFNGGQTCIAPDYLLVEGGRVEQLVTALRRSIADFYPQGAISRDLTAMVNAEQYARLRAWLDAAAAAGARLVEIGPGDAERRVLPLTLVLDAPDDSPVMQEELFGPVLPIVPVAGMQEAIDYVNARPRPLALYLFDRDREKVDAFLAQTSVGSVAVNDALVQFAQQELPFGGVGPSGIGQYHGRYSFETFSRRLPVFRQSAAFASTRFARPPYRNLADWLVRLATR